MSRYRIWILRLVPGFHYAGFLSAMVIFLLLYPLFHVGDVEENSSGVPALFFSLIIAYIIPVFSFITARADEALLELAPQLPKGSGAVEVTRSRLHTVSLRALLLQLLGGVLGGLMHMSFVRGSVSGMIDEIIHRPGALASTLGALLVWVVMTTVISMLVQQAIAFAKLGSQVRLSLLNTHTVPAFGRVAIYSSLAVLGALALFPLMGLDDGLVMSESLPGVVATMVPLFVIFIIPVWPVHRRLAELKVQELAAIATRVDACRGSGDSANLSSEKLSELVPLLTYRREISLVSSWPFDLGSVTRLLLYLVIVPLTWAGAALIEKLVDLFV